MRHVKLYLVLIIGLLFTTISIQSQEPAASAAEQKQIQDIIDKMNAAKAAGAANDSKEIRDLAAQAIHLADSFYKIARPDNLDGAEPEYDPDVKGEGVATQNGTKVKVRIGPKAFETPGWLASTKYHEFVHCGQASTGQWESPPEIDDVDDIPGSTLEEKLKYMETLLAKLTKAHEANEVEAYDKELEAAKKYGLTEDQIKEVEKRRKQHYDELDSANKAKIDSLKKANLPYKIAMVEKSDQSMYVLTRSTELFVSGTVLSEERTLVTIRGTEMVEGVVVTAEYNGKTVDATTDKKGHAWLDMSAITGGLVGTAIATLTVFDPKGKQLTSTTTRVEQGQPMIFDRPETTLMPDNIPSRQVVTIPGKNLGVDANLVIGDKIQETLAASDYEITTFTDSKPGSQPAYVITANGISQSQMVNIYSMSFNLPQNTVKPDEKVAAQLTYESIPVGTKLVFTNRAPGTIRMAIPGGMVSGDDIMYTVSQTNGTIPVNITGKRKGNFAIAVNSEFRNNNYTR